MKDEQDWKKVKGSRFLSTFLITLVVMASIVCVAIYVLSSFSTEAEYTPNVIRHGVFMGYWDPASDSSQTWGMTMTELDMPFIGDEYTFIFEQQNELDVLRTLKVGEPYLFGFFSENRYSAGMDSVFQLITVMDENENVLWNYYD